MEKKLLKNKIKKYAGYTVLGYFLIVLMMNLVFGFFADETKERYYPTFNIFGFNESQYVPLDEID